MPQPIRFARRIPFNFTPDAVLERPELAPHIAVISALWNDIDGRIAAFLAALVGQQAPTLIHVYLGIRNDGAKRSTIDTICEHHLQAASRIKFTNILKSIGNRYADRNLVIHGSWGTSHLYPKKLLWADIRNITKFHLDMMRLSVPEQHLRFVEEQKKMIVYGLEDFIAMERRIDATYKELCDFTAPFINVGFGGNAIANWRPSVPRNP